MTYKISFTSEANLDITESVKYYEDQQTGLGSKFVKELEKKIYFLTKNPFSLSIKYDEVRTIHLDKFPFLIHFYFNKNGKEVLILGVLHTGRNPKIWEERNN